MELIEILQTQDIGTKIEHLKQRSSIIPSWPDIVKDYEPMLHTIVEDRKGRADKVHNDGTVDKAARIPIGLEKLLTKRVTEFTFAIPVKRVYTAEGETQQAIAKAIEAIYQAAHIDTENIKRGHEYYGSCEIFTIWFVTNKNEAHDLYGFPTKFKLKCRTLSPMNGCRLYPLFDETGDLLAISVEYERKVGTEIVTFFEAFTDSVHYKWKQSGKEWEEEESEPITIAKIPGAFLMRPQPIFDGLQRLREDLEYTISRNSDIVAYNASPILKIVGALVGEEHKGETRRVYRVNEGGDVSYVSWAQSVEALKFHTDALLRFFWLQSQMPDISFDTMKGLGNIGYDARKMLLTDAHLKIGEESGPWLEFLNRECNVIKTFLKHMNVKWADEIDKVNVEHIITPFIIEDEAAQLDYHMKANGNKPVESHRESIQRIGKSANVDHTLAEIQKDIAAQAAEEAKKTEKKSK